MIVVDTSALVAIARDEPERGSFLQILAQETDVALSAVTWLEARMVLFNLMGEGGDLTLRNLMSSVGIRVEAVSPDLADHAFTAFRRFGKGRHPARLNICDCFAYALAREIGAPLLFKGGDFGKTDIVPAVRGL